LKTTNLTAARFLPSYYYDGVTRTFSGVRERDREVALKLGLTRFVRHGIRGEWPAGWLATRNKQVIDQLDDDYVIVTFDKDGHYIKEAGSEIDAQTGKLGKTIRRRGRSTGRRRA